MNGYSTLLHNIAPGEYIVIKVEYGLQLHFKYFFTNQIKKNSNKQEISLKKIFGGSQILTINATKFAGLDEGATPLGPYSATRGFTW